MKLLILSTLALALSATQALAQGPLSFKVTKTFTSFAATPLAPRETTLFFPITQGQHGPEAGNLIEDAPNSSQTACYFEVEYAQNALTNAGAGLYTFPWTTLVTGTFVAKRTSLDISNQGGVNHVRVKFDVLTTATTYAPQVSRGSAVLKSVTCTGLASSLAYSANAIGNEILERATNGFIEIDRAE